MCGKEPYANRDLATQAAAGISRKIRLGMKVYRCKMCGMLHLTAIKKKRLRRLYKEGKYPLRLENYLNFLNNGYTTAT